MMPLDQVVVALLAVGCYLSALLTVQTVLLAMAVHRVIAMRKRQCP